MNYVVIPGERTDLFNDPASPYSGANANRFGGYFSDLYFDRARNDWWSLSDRGPGGGVVDYATRVQDLNFNVDPNTGALPASESGITIQRTVPFTNGNDYYRGLNAQYVQTTEEGPRAKEQNDLGSSRQLIFEDIKGLRLPVFCVPLCCLPDF